MEAVAKVDLQGRRDRVAALAANVRVLELVLARERSALAQEESREVAAQQVHRINDTMTDTAARVLGIDRSLFEWRPGQFDVL